MPNSSRATRFDSAGSLVSYRLYDTLRVPMEGMRPEDLLSTKIQPEEMSLSELSRRVEALRRAGKLAKRGRRALVGVWAGAPAGTMAG